MTVVLACPTCQQKIRAPQTVLGRQIKCPQCKNAFMAQEPGDIVATAVRAVPPREIGSAPVVEPFALEDGDDRPESAPADMPVLSEPADIAAPRPPSKLVDYLMLRRMVTPSIIVAVFYLGVLAILGGGLFSFLATVIDAINYRSFRVLGLITAIVTLILIPVGLVLWRIACEVLIALFRILEYTRDIHEKLKP